MLLVNSTPAGPKLASSIVNKYGNSSARTVPVTLKYAFDSNHD
jgi:3-oxoacyl-[acyl-carrier-protein] synthase III